MITYDLNRIGHFTQRMFYCAWREARADRIHVLPQVQTELLKEWDIRTLEQSRRQRERELQERKRSLPGHRLPALRVGRTRTCDGQYCR